MSRTHKADRFQRYMIFATLPLGFALSAAAPASAVEVWAGLDYSFSRANWSDWNAAENQDRITDNVWITRANTEGIFNIATEGGYSEEFSMTAL